MRKPLTGGAALQVAGKLRSRQEKGLSLRKLASEAHLPLTTTARLLALDRADKRLKSLVRGGRVGWRVAVGLVRSDSRARRQALRDLGQGKRVSVRQLEKPRRRIDIPQDRLPSGVVGAVFPGRIELRIRPPVGAGERPTSAELKAYLPEGDWHRVWKALIQTWGELT